MASVSASGKNAEVAAQERMDLDYGVAEKRDHEISRYIEKRHMSASSHDSTK